MTISTKFYLVQQLFILQLSKGLRLSDNGNDAKYRTLEIKKHTEKACSVIKTYRAQLLRVMPEQNLQQLLKLNKEQLKQMNFSEMSFSSRSRYELITIETSIC